jgi:predicted ATPase
VGAVFITVLGLEQNPALTRHLIALATHHEEPTETAKAQSPISNLTPQLTHFIGREDDVCERERLLNETRLLVLVGAGGMGKTRLAYELASRVAGRGDEQVIFVELAQMNAPAGVAEAVANALHLPIASGRTADQVLLDHLRTRRQLLVLDNCEHVLRACAHLAETLLRGCPQLRILATSREAFGTLSAMTWRVPALNEADALQLFADRARQSRPGFALAARNIPIVADICARLDGMPLAIELAATRVRTLSVEQIAERLTDRFSLLTNACATALPRQQTLRATIDWR